ncbi:MAG TPA: hypothetical protein VGC10_04780 [Sphingomonas sp.]
MVRRMGRDIASVAADLVARFGDAADEEARRQFASARDDERGRDAQHWISVVFFLARNPDGLSAA